MDLTHLYPFMQAAATTVNTTTPQFTMPSQTHYQQRNTNILVSPTQSSKRPRDFYDQEDLKSHSSRLAARITKHGLHNYGLAMDLYDAIARTLIPYVEYNERFKLKFMKQIHLDTMVTVPSGFSDIAQHVRTRLQMLCDEYSSNTNGLVETKTSAITNETSKTNAMDLISGAPSVYLENSQHGKVIQMLANILGIEIRLVTSYVYEEIISVQPHDILEKEPLYIAYNDVSKQYYMVDKPTNIRRDELSNHQYCLEQLIQKYHLNVVPKSSLGLSLFSATAQSLKNISIKNPIVESVVRKYFNMNGVFENELAVLLRDMTYKQLKSNFDYYETYVQIKPKHFDIRRDSKSLIDCTYYRYQLEKVVLYALAHVIQCNMIVFSSDVKQAKPDVIRVDPSMDNNKDIIILLKNESTQHYDSAVPNYSLRNLIGTITSNESLVNGNRHAQHSNVNQQSEKTSASNKASMDDPIYESIDPSSPVPDISLPPAAPPTNSNTYYRQLSVPASNTRSNDTYVGATMPTNSNEKKGDLKSKFFSKTKEKFVTAFNKVVENGSLPKKPQVYRNNGQSLNNLFAPTQIGATSSSDRYIEHRPSLEIKDYSTLVQTPLQSSNIPSVKRQAPIAEVIRRQQQQQLIENNTYQNTQPRNLSESDIISLSQQNKHSRPVNNQSQTSIRQPSEIPRATENTRDHLIPYKDRQRSKITLNMSSNSAVKKGNIYNSVTLEDVDDSTEEIDFTNSLTDDDTVILRDVNQQNTVDRQKSNVSKVKTGSHHYDHDTLTRQQQSRYVDDDFTDEESENDIRQYDDVKRLLSENDSTTTDPQQAEDEEEEDIYISTTDIVQRDKKQLQLFVSDKINHFNHLNCSPSLNDRKLSTSSLSNKDVKRSNDTRKKQYIHDLTNVELRRPKDQQRSETTTAMCKDSQNEVVDSHRQLKSDSMEKPSSSCETTNDPSSTHNNRKSYLIDKDGVLEVLGQNDILQRDRHILMKVLKQEDLLSKEWQRLLYLLEEYVNNPKREKKERGLHALTLMENLDRLGYDLLEIQSTSANEKNNHFKAITKSLLLTMEINDWLNDHICSILHITNAQDQRFTKHLRKLCIKSWQKHYDDYRKMWMDKYPNSNTKTFDFQREIENFRSENYYRLDMCFLVNQALADAFGIPIHIIRAIRDGNPVEIIRPIRIARPGINIVLISSQKSDGHYDVAVLKGHPQTLKKQRNVTFDEKPEIRSFKVDDEQTIKTSLPSTPTSIPTTINSLPSMRQPNNRVLLNTGAQFYPQFALPNTIYPFNNYFSQQYMPQMMQTSNNDAKLSPSLTRATSSNSKSKNMNNLTTNASSTTTTTPMIVQNSGIPSMSYGTPASYMPLQPTPPTFMYNTMMHQPNMAAVPPGAFYYTTSTYPM